MPAQPTSSWLKNLKRLYGTKAKPQKFWQTPSFYQQYRQRNNAQIWIGTKYGRPEVPPTTTTVKGPVSPFWGTYNTPNWQNAAKSPWQAVAPRTDPATAKDLLQNVYPDAAPPPLPTPTTPGIITTTRQVPAPTPGARSLTKAQQYFEKQKAETTTTYVTNFEGETVPITSRPWSPYRKFQEVVETIDTGLSRHVASANRGSPYAYIAWNGAKAAWDGIVGLYDLMLGPPLKERNIEWPEGTQAFTGNIGATSAAMGMYIYEKAKARDFHFSDFFHKFFPRMEESISHLGEAARMATSPGAADWVKTNLAYRQRENAEMVEYMNKFLLGQPPPPIPIAPIGTESAENYGQFMRADQAYYQNVAKPRHDAALEEAREKYETPALATLDELAKITTAPQPADSPEARQLIATAKAQTAEALEAKLAVDTTFRDDCYAWSWDMTDDGEQRYTSFKNAVIDFFMQHKRWPNHREIEDIQDLYVMPVAEFAGENIFSLLNLTPAVVQKVAFAPFPQVLQFVGKLSTKFLGWSADNLLLVGKTINYFAQETLSASAVKIANSGVQILSPMLKSPSLTIGDAPDLIRAVYAAKAGGDFNGLRAFGISERMIETLKSRSPKNLFNWFTEKDLLSMDVTATDRMDWDLSVLQDQLSSLGRSQQYIKEAIDRVARDKARYLDYLGNIISERWKGEHRLWRNGPYDEGAFATLYKLFHPKKEELPTGVTDEISEFRAMQVQQAEAEGRGRWASAYRGLNGTFNILKGLWSAAILSLRPGYPIANRSDIFLRFTFSEPGLSGIFDAVDHVDNMLPWVPRELATRIGDMTSDLHGDLFARVVGGNPLSPREIIREAADYYRNIRKWGPLKTFLGVTADLGKTFNQQIEVQAGIRLANLQFKRNWNTIQMLCSDEVRRLFPNLPPKAQAILSELRLRNFGDTASFLQQAEQIATGKLNKKLPAFLNITDPEFLRDLDQYYSPGTAFKIKQDIVTNLLKLHSAGELTPENIRNLMQQYIDLVMDAMDRQSLRFRAAIAEEAGNVARSSVDPREEIKTLIDNTLDDVRKAAGLPGEEMAPPAPPKTGAEFDPTKAAPTNPTEPVIKTAADFEKMARAAAQTFLDSINQIKEEAQVDMEQFARELKDMGIDWDFTAGQEAYHNYGEKLAQSTAKLFAAIEDMLKPAIAAGAAPPTLPLEAYNYVNGLKLQSLGLKKATLEVFPGPKASFWKNRQRRWTQWWQMMAVAEDGMAKFENEIAEFMNAGDWDGLSQRLRSLPDRETFFKELGFDFQFDAGKLIGMRHRLFQNGRWMSGNILNNFLAAMRAPIDWRTHGWFRSSATDTTAALWKLPKQEIVQILGQIDDTVRTARDAGTAVGYTLTEWIHTLRPRENEEIYRGVQGLDKVKRYDKVLSDIVDTFFTGDEKARDEFLSMVFNLFEQGKLEAPERIAEGHQLAWEAILGSTITYSNNRPIHFAQRWKRSNYNGQPVLSSFETWKAYLLEKITQETRRGRTDVAQELELMLKETEQKYFRLLHGGGMMNENVGPVIGLSQLPKSIEFLFNNIRESNTHADMLIDGLANWGAMLESRIQSGDIFLTLAKGELGDQFVDAAKATANLYTNGMDAALYGGKFLGKTVEGAVPKTVTTLIDYSDTNNLDALIKPLYPFWMFPSRSIPWWLYKVLERPGIVAEVNKIYDMSRRYELQYGLVSVKTGEPLPSMNGYLPIPSTEIWINPLQQASVRYALQPFMELDALLNVEGELTARTPVETLMNFVTEWSTTMGVFAPPWTNMALRALGWAPEDRPMWPLIPQAELLLPPYAHHALLKMVGDVSGNSDWLENLLWPNPPWMDYLIAQRMLENAVAYVEDPNNNDGDKRAYVYLVRRAVNEKVRVDDPQAMAFWEKAQLELENEDYISSTAGYLSSYWPKFMSADKMRLIQLRRDNALLDAALDDALVAAKTPMFAETTNAELKWDARNESKYGGYVGDILGMRNIISHVPADQERSTYINNEMLKQEATDAYNAARKAARDELKKELTKYPLGTPWEVLEPIYDKYFKAAAGIDSSPMYDAARRGWVVGAKPRELVAQDLEALWWSILKSTYPTWEDDMKWADYEAAVQSWLGNLSNMAKLAPAMLEFRLKYSDIEFYDETKKQDPNKVIAQLMLTTNAEGYQQWSLHNDDLLTALNKAYTQKYMREYWDSVEDKSMEEREIAERAFFEKYPNGATAEHFIKWVRELYGDYSTKWSDREIREFVTNRGQISAQQRLSASRGKYSEEEEKVWETIGWVAPGDQYTEFVRNLQLYGSNDSDLNIFMGTGGQGEGFSNEERFKKFAAAVEEVARLMNLARPSDQELQLRAQARQENEQLKLSQAQTFGPEAAQIIGYYYDLNSSQREAYRTANQELYEQIIKPNFEFRKQFAAEHPVWASYYMRDEMLQTTTSGGGGGGRAKAFPKLTPTQTAQYVSGNSYIPMGFRSTLDPRELLRPGSVGRGGAGGKLAWPKALKQAVGSVVTEDLDRLIENGTPLPAGAQKILQNAATTQPSLKPLVQEILSVAGRGGTRKR